MILCISVVRQNHPCNRVCNYFYSMGDTTINPIGVISEIKFLLIALVILQKPVWYLRHNTLLTLVVIPPSDSDITPRSTSYNGRHQDFGEQYGVSVTHMMDDMIRSC